MQTWCAPNRNAAKLIQATQTAARTCQCAHLLNKRDPDYDLATNGPVVVAVIVAVTWRGLGWPARCELRPLSLKTVSADLCEQNLAKAELVALT